MIAYRPAPPSAIFPGAALWLEIGVPGAPEIPRVLVEVVSFNPDAGRVQVEFQDRTLATIPAAALLTRSPRDHGAQASQANSSYLDSSPPATPDPVLAEIEHLRASLANWRAWGARWAPTLTTLDAILAGEEPPETLAQAFATSSPGNGALRAWFRSQLNPPPADPQPDSPEAERQAILAYLAQVRIGCVADGDTRYGSFVEGLENAIASGKHRENRPDADPDIDLFDNACLAIRLASEIRAATNELDALTPDSPAMGWQPEATAARIATLEKRLQHLKAQAASHLIRLQETQKEAERALNPLLRLIARS